MTNFEKTVSKKDRKDLKRRLMFFILNFLWSLIVIGLDYIIYWIQSKVSVHLASPTDMRVSLKLKNTEEIVQLKDSDSQIYSSITNGCNLHPQLTDIVTIIAILVIHCMIIINSIRSDTQRPYQILSTFDGIRTSWYHVSYKCYCSNRHAINKY